MKNSGLEAITFQFIANDKFTKPTFNEILKLLFFL